MVTSGLDVRREGDAKSVLSRSPLNLLVPGTAHCFYLRLEMKAKAGAGPFCCHRERGVETRIVRIFTPYGPLCEILGLDLASGWSG
jgi:hypothetical protein